MAAETQNLIKDLISTVEEKVNKPIAESNSALTSEFYSDPASTRNRLVTENAGNPLNPLAIDELVAGRRGAIGGQIAGNQQLAGSNADLLGNFFNIVNSMSQQANQLAASRSNASKKNYELVETDDGLRAYDPETGTFVGDVLGQGKTKYDQSDIENFAQAIASGQFGTDKDGYVDASAFSKVPQEIRAQVSARVQEIINSQQQEDGGGSSFLNIFKSLLPGGQTPTSAISNFFAGIGK